MDKIFFSGAVFQIYVLEFLGRGNRSIDRKGFFVQWLCGASGMKKKNPMDSSDLAKLASFCATLFMA